MSVGQTRSARHKIKMRYRNPRRRSVAEVIAAERIKAAREANARKKKK